MATVDDFARIAGFCKTDLLQPVTLGLSGGKTELLLHTQGGAVENLTLTDGANNLITIQDGNPVIVFGKVVVPVAHFAATVLYYRTTIG